MSFKGRPSNVTKDPFPSRSNRQCPVCGSEKRYDKLQGHLVQLCHFDKDGNPILPDNSAYAILSKEAKQHTEYCVAKGIKKDTLHLSWKRLSPTDTRLNPFEAMKKRQRQPSQSLSQNLELIDNASSSSSEATESEATFPMPDISQTLPPPPPPPIALPLRPPSPSRLSSSQSSSTPPPSEQTIVTDELIERFSEELKFAGQNVLEGLNYETLAEKICEKMKSLESSGDDEIFGIQECFMETDDEKLYCAPCIKHTSSSAFPDKLRLGIKGNHGIFNKPNAQNYKTNKERKKRMADHCRTDIHKWCVNQDRVTDEQSTAEKKENDRCAEVIVTSAVECLLELDGSKKFERTNNLLEILLPEEYPTKNDGRQVFYSIREIVFDKLTESVKDRFQKVKNACFTLDKVTVRRTPFTVIMTYFFSGGKIHVLLNSVHKMKVEEYSGRGSAEMIGKTLMASLGLSKAQVGEKFRHGTYDGVYAMAEERVAGGGSLNLMLHFADWCQLPHENFTGHWDVGHKLQLVYGSALKKNQEVSAFLNVMEKVMQMCQGKDGLLFLQVAVELKAAILTDKSEQTTRWVRSLLRLILAYFRNMPVLQRIICKNIDDARQEGDLSEQKKQQKLLDSFCNPSHIAFGVGFAQILDSYALVSMNAQQLWNFPGTLCIAMKSLSSELEHLSTKFIWKEENLQITGIGNPAMHIANLKKGVYKTHLSETVKTSAAIRLNLSQLEDYKENPIETGISGALSDEPEAIFLTGEDIEELDFSLLSLENALQEKVEATLEKVCTDLAHSLNERFQIPPLFEQSVKAFHETEWLQDNAEPNKEKMMIAKLAAELKNPPLVAEILGNIDATTDSYIKYLQFKSRNDSKTVEKLYQEFYNQFFTDDRKPFFEMFEFINIKSYSEAYCESVGSLMNICVNKGRNLAPANFSKEIIIAFNAPPLHIMKQKIIPEVVQEWRKDGKQLRRKLEKGQKSKLTFVTSAAIGNYRKRDEANSHVPTSFFI